MYRQNEKQFCQSSYFSLLVLLFIDISSKSFLDVTAMYPYCLLLFSLNPTPQGLDFFREILWHFMVMFESLIMFVMVTLFWEMSRSVLKAWSTQCLSLFQFVINTVVANIVLHLCCSLFKVSALDIHKLLICLGS